MIGSSDLLGDIVHSENWDAAESVDDEGVLPRSARSLSGTLLGPRVRGRNAPVHGSMTRDEAEIREQSTDGRMNIIYLLPSRSVVLPSDRLLFDIVYLIPKFAKQFLMHCRRLLRVSRYESLRHRVLDVSLDKGVQIRRQYVSKMARDIRAQKQLFHLIRKTLPCIVI